MSPSLESASIAAVLLRVSAHRERQEWAAMITQLEAVPVAAVVDSDQRHAVLESLFFALLRSEQYERALGVLRQFGTTHTGDDTVTTSSELFDHLRRTTGKTIVASLDAKRMPRPNEIVIRYGDYPLGFEHLPCHNPVSRHLRYFWQTQHDVVEYDAVWEPVARIYIINLDTRADRYIETLRELKRMGIPLSRVTRFPASCERVTDDPVLNGYIGCNRSHLGVIRRIIAESHENALVLEDDFCFSEDLVANRESIVRFFSRGYLYDVCLLAASNRADLAAHDDLLVHNRQIGTTTSGYFVSAAGARKLEKIWSTALERLITTRETRYVADQIWASLQEENRFFMFARKLGFQRPSRSSITGQMVLDLD